MKPIICMTGAITDEGDVTLLAPYVKAIEQAGGTPLLVPYTENEQTLARVCEIAHGFFFTGGKDVDPARYGADKHPACGDLQPLRDALELSLFAHAYGTGKPILGICRGLQLINVALGGTLYQDLPSEYPSRIPHVQTEPKFEHSHSVRVLMGTPLYNLIGSAQLAANSFHHQAVKTLGAGLSVMARADDGVIEAFFETGTRYLRAYQWHPERLVAISADNRALFADFVKACAQA